MPRSLIALLTAALVLLPAASANAGWFGAQPLDGPNADVVSVGNVDLARDGAGAVAYIRNADGVPHAFISRLNGGRWLPVERVDPTLGGAVTEVKVAVGDANRIAVAWIADGIVYATSTPAGDTPGGFAPIATLGGPGAESLDIDLGVNGAAYAIWQEGGNVTAARLQDAALVTGRSAAGHRSRARGRHRDAAPARRRVRGGLRGRDLGRADGGRLDARLRAPDHRA